MNSYLHALPFHNNGSKLSSCECPGQGFDPSNFKLYTEADRLPTFVLRLPPIGAKPDLTYANECIHVMDCAGIPVASLTMLEAGISLKKDAVSYYVIYDGRPVKNLKLTCGGCYKLRITNFYSEVFYVTDIPSEKVRIELQNSSVLGDVPYETGFKQILLIDGEICSLSAEILENRKSESNGSETVTFQKLTSRKSLSIYQMPDFVAELIGSIPLHETFKVIHRGETYEVLQKRAKPDVSQQGCCDYDAEIILPLRDISIAGGVCQTDSGGKLVEVVIPANLPDSCDVENDYVATKQTLCLRFGEVPPPIDSSIVPPVTQPPGETCPPANFIVSTSTQIVTCDNPFIVSGIKYKTKITKTVAIGDCTTKQVIEYADPCQAIIVKHKFTGISCDSPVIVLPPPVTPPVTPPVGTRQAKYEFILGTTGYGLDRFAQYGIASEWVERIEAFNYSWGWGITGVALWVNWDDYEPTPGNFQTAALQKAIAYCDARGLGLSLVFGARRTKGDGFLRDSEIVKGSRGRVYEEGGQKIYASLGCDRVNALLVPAVKSMATLLKGYSRKYYFSVFGGTAGELVNHVMDNGGPESQLADFSDDSLARFNTWCSSRGLATPGTPPIVDGNNIAWPYPDFNQPRGVEFSRFMSHSIAKHYTNIVRAVKSVAPEIPCIYLYAACDNIQLRSTMNANLDYIAGAAGLGGGMYSSDGEGIYSMGNKILSNAINLGTFPNGISMQEIDPDDVSTYKYDHNGAAPPYGQANPQYNVMKTTLQKLYERGCEAPHTAMSFSPQEIAGMSDVLQALWQIYIGKPYVRPVINSSNLVTVEVTQKYRTSQNIAAGIDPNTKYIKYTSNDFWGGVNPPAL